ncbi:MAG: FtsW/RodA/SpoVE family cell cycle protein [Clostridia bacterium]|nr:FtsW/RodA/SpoVE family cell cycle protein [Clostridia bacterium]
MIVENRRARAKVDVILIALVLAISLVGIWAVTVATYSTSSTSDEPFINHVMETQSARRQCLFFAVGVIIIVAMMAIPYDLIKRWSVRLYVLTTAVVAFVWLVNRAQGVKQWLDILWGYTVQPTEFAKLATILMLAFLFSRSDRPMQDHHEALIVMILIGALSGIIVASGEMGSLMVILFTTLLMMWFGNVSPKLIFGIVGLGLLGVAALVGFALVTGSDSYRLQRILGFIFPEQYSSTSAYQQMRSKIAIGSGGAYGIGSFVDGSMSQLNYVPADWTDFIFATIGEALGFYKCVAIILLYLAIILRMFYLGLYTYDKYGRLVIFGVMSMMIFHVLENIGMTIGVMPITGIPLPFLSYGGSNMVTNMGGVGLVLNVTRNRSLTAGAVPTPQRNTVISRYIQPR